MPQLLGLCGSHMPSLELCMSFPSSLTKAAVAHQVAEKRVIETRSFLVGSRAE